MPIQSNTHFDHGPGGIGNSTSSNMESSRSTRAMKRRSLVSQKELQESFLLPAEGAVTFDCLFCDESYDQHKDLSKHVLSKHRPTLCEPMVLCFEAEYLDPQEKRRQITSSATEEEPQSSDCEVCGETFTESSDREAHMKKHKDSFTYSCDICWRRFKEPWFLKNHRKSHTSRTGGRNKQPPVPEPPITINEIVQESVTESLTSPYKLCMTCGFHFPDKETLLDHSKIHKKSPKPEDKPTNAASGKENVNTNKPVKNSQENFLSFLNLKSTSAPPSKPATNSKWIPELDPFNTYQAWQLATKGKVAEQKIEKEETSAEAPVVADLPDKEEVIGIPDSFNLDQPVQEEESVKSENAEDSVPQDSSDLTNNQEKMPDAVPEKRILREKNTAKMQNVVTEKRTLRVKITAKMPNAAAEKQTLHENDKSKQCTDCGKLFKTNHKFILHARVHRKDRTDLESSASTGSPKTPAEPKDEGNEMEVVAPSYEGTKMEVVAPSYEGSKMEVVAPSYEGSKMEVVAPSYEGNKMEVAAPTDEGNKMEVAIPTDEGNKMEAVLGSEEGSGTPSAGAAAPAKTKRKFAGKKKASPASRQCEYCKKSFRSNYYLKIHRRTHTGEKPFKCDYCTYAAAQKTSLRYHLEKHHSFRKGEANARVKSISKALKLLLKMEQEGSQSADQPQQPLPMSDDKGNPPSTKRPKRMSALRNKFVNTRQGQKKRCESVKVKTEEIGPETPIQPPETPTLPTGEEISLACAETLDDDLCMEENTKPDLCFKEDTTKQDQNKDLCFKEDNAKEAKNKDLCFMEEKKKADQNKDLNVNLVPEVAQSAMDLCVRSVRRLSTKSINRSLLAICTCPYCTLKTLYPEVMDMHQRLVHKQEYELCHKGAAKLKNPALLLKMRRTGCPPFLKGVDVAPLLQECNRPKHRFSPQPKPTEKPKRVPAQANKVAMPAQANKVAMPAQANKVANPPNVEQENKPHPVKQSNHQNRNNRFMQPDLQGITHLLERMPKVEQIAPQWNPSTSQKSSPMGTNDHPFPAVPVWSAEHPFNRAGMAHPEVRAKQNIPNSLPTAYLNAESARRLQPCPVSVMSPQVTPSKSTNPPLLNNVSHPHESDPHWNRLRPFDHTAAGPSYRNPNVPLASGSASTMEATPASLYQRMSKRGLETNEKTN